MAPRQSWDAYEERRWALVQQIADGLTARGVPVVWDSTGRHLDAVGGKTGALRLRGGFGARREWNGRMWALVGRRRLPPDVGRIVTALTLL